MIDVLISFIPSVIMMCAPLIIIALGGLVCEKSGIVNIGLEGLLNVGAFSAATVHFLLQNTTEFSTTIAIVVAMITGLLFSLIHAYATITFKADQIISGTGLNLICLGASAYACQVIFKNGRTPAFSAGLKVDSFLGIYPTFYYAIIVFVIVWYVLYKRPFGLKLAACGYNATAAQSAGINVNAMQYFGVCASGVLGGLAGASFVLTQTIQYTPNFINGKGFIALAAITFGNLKPKGVTSAATLFGLVVAMSIYIENFIDSNKYINSDLFNSIPYFLTFFTLIIFKLNDTNKKL